MSVIVSVNAMTNGHSFYDDDVAAEDAHTPHDDAGPHLPSWLQQLYSSNSSTSGTMLGLILFILGVANPINSILPEIVYPSINHILEDHFLHEQTASENTVVDADADKVMEDATEMAKDIHDQINTRDGVSLQPQNLTSGHLNESSQEKLDGNEAVPTLESLNKTGETEAHLTKSIIQTDENENNENNINHECIIDEDCDKGKYCLYQPHRSNCLPCKSVDVACAKDEECCDGQLCVWGQCSQNTTKGDAGSLCQNQDDCNTDLCCAFHKALLFPVCSAKPIERERCFIPSNHLMELVSWDVDREAPREHCPCAGNLQCQFLGRGSLCLKGQNSSEEEMTDALYSEIDYIV